jgi:hypothetical protein
MSGLHDLALWLAGAGHFVLLAAGVQVPFRFGWREELLRLRPMNRKLMWTYAGFTLGTLVAFGILTLVLHDEMLRGDRSAAALAGFIALFWTARIATDAWFGHDGWPPGRRFVLGHVLLELLFIALAGTYAFTAWRAWT